MRDAVMAALVSLALVGGCRGTDVSSRTRSSDGRPDASLEASAGGRTARDSAVLDAGPSWNVDAAPWNGKVCDGGGWACRMTSVVVLATTPAGTLTFDYASFAYEIGFGCDTQIYLSKGPSNEVPTLLIYLEGNPICGAAGPGDYTASFELRDCEGQYLETRGAVHVYANEITGQSDGGTVAHLDIEVNVDAPGWRIHSRFQVPVLCGVFSST